MFQSSRFLSFSHDTPSSPSPSPSHSSIAVENEECRHRSDLKTSRLLDARLSRSTSLGLMRIRPHVPSPLTLVPAPISPQRAIVFEKRSPVLSRPRRFTQILKRFISRTCRRKSTLKTTMNANQNTHVTADAPKRPGVGSRTRTDDITRSALDGSLDYANVHADVLSITDVNLDSPPPSAFTFSTSVPATPITPGSTGDGPGLGFGFAPVSEVLDEMLGAAASPGYGAGNRPGPVSGMTSPSSPVFAEMRTLNRHFQWDNPEPFACSAPARVRVEVEEPVDPMARHVSMYACVLNADVEDEEDGEYDEEDYADYASAYSGMAGSMHTFACAADFLPSPSMETNTPSHYSQSCSHCRASSPVLGDYDKPDDAASLYDIDSILSLKSGASSFDDETDATTLPSSSSPSPCPPTPRMSTADLTTPLSLEEFGDVSSYLRGQKKTAPVPSHRKTMQMLGLEATVVRDRGLVLRPTMYDIPS